VRRKAMARSLGDILSLVSTKTDQVKILADLLNLCLDYIRHGEEAAPQATWVYILTRDTSCTVEEANRLWNHYFEGE